MPEPRIAPSRRRFIWGAALSALGAFAGRAFAQGNAAAQGGKTLAQDQFAASLAREQIAADFSTDQGALAYANAELDRLVASLRYSLEKHIVGWPLDEKDRALNTYEALRHTFRNLSMAHAGHYEADYDNPTLTKMGGTNRIQFQQQSPDCNYHMALLHGDYSYRLKGYRGTSHIFQVTVFKGHSCDFADGWKQVSIANNIDTPALAPGKTIDVVISRTKPADLGDAVWMELPEGRAEIHLRQYYADWDNEKPADLSLTRIDQTFPARELTKETSEVRFKRMIDLMRVHADFYRKGVQGHLDSNPDVIDEYKVPGAFVGTNYYHGHFRCGPDQAVLIEIDEPDCRYWNVTLDQMQWEPGDWWAKLVSFNFKQVHRTGDGKVRWVASWADPGVPNWLDCSGRELSLIAFRFFQPKAQPNGPRLKVIPLAELSRHIPAGTPRITPAARRAEMKRRLDTVYRRRFSDF